MGKSYITLFLSLLVTIKALSVQEDTASLTKELRCLVCHGQSIADSDTDFAINVRKVIKDKSQEGFSSQQIKHYLVERYGEEISTTPSSEHVALWGIPWLGLTIILISTLRAFYKLASINLSRSNNRSIL